MSEVKINELIDIEKIKPEEFFTIDGFEATLSRIEADVKSIILDVTTEKGKKEIASLAHKIARSKTAIDDLGKDFVSVLKEKSKKVDEARKSIRDQLDQLKEEIRRPLTELEEKEKERLLQQRFRLDGLNNLMSASYSVAAAVLVSIDYVENFKTDDLDTNFRTEAEISKNMVLKKLKERYQELIKKEQDELEIAKLKAERSEADQKERERKIAEEASKRAKEEQERINKDELIKGEKERARLEFELEQAEKIKQREIQEIKDKQVAEENRIKKEKEERERIEKARAEDVKHRAEVNTKAKEALMKNCSIDEAMAKNILTAVIKGLVPNVSIKY